MTSTNFDGADDPVRQTVQLIGTSAGQVTRDDIEIAAELLFGSADESLRLFDSVAALEACVVRKRFLYADFGTLKTKAMEMLVAGLATELAATVGGKLSPECSQRLTQASNDAPLRHHLFETTADHFAFDALECLRSMLRIGSGPVLVSIPDDFDTARLKGTPFLCLLASMENGHA